MESAVCEKQIKRDRTRFLYSVQGNGSWVTVVVIQRSGFKTHIATANLTIAIVKRPDLMIDGPLQYDAAVMADVAKSKAPNSPVAYGILHCNIYAQKITRILIAD